MRNEKVWGVKHGEKTNFFSTPTQTRSMATWTLWQIPLLAQTTFGPLILPLLAQTTFDPLILPLLARPLLAQTTFGQDDFWP